MGWAIRVALVVSMAGCSLLVDGGGSSDPDAAPAPPDAAVFGDCEVDGELACEGDALAECRSNVLVEIESCALACSEAGGAHCSTFQPSNLTGDDFGEASGALVVPIGEILTIDTGFDLLNPPPAARVQGQDEAPTIAVFRYTDIQIDGRVEITGARLIALVSSGDVSISGTVEVIEGFDFDCALPPADGFRFGGAGGGHGSLGGTGGGVTSGGGSALSGSEELSPLVPGCNGGAGGGAAGPGGLAGGGLQVAAAGTLTISGNLCGSGFGGGSVANSGGGGGGAGGAILLEAVSIVLEAGAAIVTHGGGGAGGGSIDGSGGMPGEHGCNPANAPKGGNPDGSDVGVFPGRGGNGGTGTKTGDPGANAPDGNPGGGGGGGGGVGRIRLNSAGDSVATDGVSLSGVMTQGTLAPRD